MYNFESAQRTNTKDSIFRGYWIIILSAVFVILIIAFPYSQPNNPTVVKALSIPEDTTAQINNSQENNKSGWLQNWGLDSNVIIEELRLLWIDIINIPNNHFKDVRDNHHHPGLLPTMNSQERIIQESPCVRVNIIYTDGRVETTCISKTIYHD